MCIEHTTNCTLSYSKYLQYDNVAHTIGRHFDKKGIKFLQFETLTFHNIIFLTFMRWDFTMCQIGCSALFAVFTTVTVNIVMSITQSLVESSHKVARYLKITTNEMTKNLFQSKTK